MNEDYAPHKRILDYENVIVVCGIGNWAQAGWKIYNEDELSGDRYTAASPNSKYNNKISVTGYNSWGANNYYSPRYSVYGGLKTAMPVGFKKDKRNLVMPMIPLIASNNTESQNTDASFPTSVASAVV